MPDYGHPIRFGTFITPVNRPPQQAVALAQRSEELGYDFATFQDHPYQAAFHDTWTLLSYIAARTERIGLSGNVLNLPLRQPAVLARSAASLDLLTGGRVALGLGAGAFGGPAVAMGAPDRTAGENVTALDEAIDVIRGIWDASERTPLRVHGEHYRVDGAKRGPAPAHDIPIWLGAYKPRMLRLTGAKADGWLPSLPYLQPGDVANGNALIDEAALTAGRDPREVARLLNVSGQEPASELLRLAVEDGVSVFIVMGDAPAAMQRFMDEVAPAIREGVERARAASGIGTDGIVRGAAALARRRPGIDYEDVPASLRAEAIEPGDRAHAAASANYLRGGSPGLILRPGSAAEVQDAVVYAARHMDVPLGVRSGGHGISGRSTNDGGIVIDLERLDGIELLDEAAGLVRIGPGARWIDVARTLAPHGLAITSGDYGGVGVGGLATAGGIGWFAREHGLTIDHLRAVEVVLADGSIVRATASEEPELFWAMRGAGGNFGVAVAFEFEAARTAEVGFAQFAYDAADTAAWIARFGEVMEQAPREVSGQFILGAPSPGRPAVGQVMLAVDAAEPERILEILQPFATVGPLLDQQVSVGTYDQVMGILYQDLPHQGRGEPVARSGLVAHLSEAFAADAVAMLATGASAFFQVRSVGGAVADVPADATAYAGRAAGFSVVALGSSAPRLDAAWAPLERHFDGMYLSFDTRTGPEVLERAFPPEHLARLRELKRRTDPTGLFRDNFYIEPAGEAASAAA
ncbi:MAG: LLM class flavin-dependent oxidoreductase [Microbacteriaceae bacterium]|nr:LLM class flavin-dependent oxidoreductase [Microbacteriaceae bacterium]